MDPAPPALRGAAVLDTRQLLTILAILAIHPPGGSSRRAAGGSRPWVFSDPRWLKKSISCKHFFDIVLASLLGGSMTVLEPNMAPTWADFGAMLEPFWSIFGCCFGSSTQDRFKMRF